MKAGFVAIAAALTLGSVATVPASAQERGVGVTRGSNGRVGSGWSRPGQQGTGRERARSSNPRDRSDPTPRDRWGSVGRVDQRPATGQPVYGVAADHRSRYHRKSYHSHTHHHGACFGHHGLHVGAHFGTAFVILVDAVAYPTYSYAAPYSVYYNPSGGTTLLQGDLGAARDALTVEELRDGIVRLNWRPDGRAVEEVGLFLADAQQRVIAVQTLRAPPFSALFQGAHGAAYVGITIAYVDGQNTTTLLPYARRW